LSISQLLVTSRIQDSSCEDFVPGNGLAKDFSYCMMRSHDAPTQVKYLRDVSSASTDTSANANANTELTLFLNLES